MTVDHCHIQEVCGPLYGLPYRHAARGPDAFDCYGLAMYLQCELAGRQMEEVEYSDDVDKQAGLLRSHSSRLKWRVVPGPSHLCLVVMSRTYDPHHIGVYLSVDGGGVMHCVRGVGVSFDRMVMVRAQWRQRVFHDWNG